MADRRSFHIRRRSAWLLGTALGWSLALPALAAPGAEVDGCPYADLSNPWFSCSGGPAAPEGAVEHVVASPDGGLTVDGAGHVVGVYAPGPAGHVSVDQQGVVAVHARDPESIGVGLVGLSSLDAPTEPAVAGPLAPSSVWLEPGRFDADDRSVFVFAAGASVRVTPETPRAEAVLGVGSLTTEDGATAEDVYVGPAEDAGEAVRAVTVFGASAVGVELAPAPEDSPRTTWEERADAAHSPHLHSSVLYRPETVEAPSLLSAAREGPRDVDAAPPGALASQGAAEDADSEPVQEVSLLAAASAATPAEARGALKAGAAAQEFWHKSADLWSARARDRRGARDEAVETWVLAQVGAESFETDPGPYGELEAGWRGVQVGVDQARGVDDRAAWWGLTAGFTDYDAEVSGEAARFELTGVNLGAYAGGTWGGFFVQALVKADLFEVDAVLDGGLTHTTFDGVTWGAQAEAGYRFGTSALFVEPSAGLAWVDADLDGFTGASGTVGYGEADGLRGRAGVRVGGETEFGEAVLAPYLGLSAVREFDGENRMRFADGGPALELVDRGRGAWGEVEAGIGAVTARGLETFAAVKGLFGGGDSGYAARLGVRWRW